MRSKSGQFKDELVRRNQAGETHQQIASAFGVDKKTITNWYKKYNLRSQYDRTRENSYQWNGGQFVNEDGYRLILLETDDPMFVMANFNGYVQEHRLVMARQLRRPLLRIETVHHIDGDRLNNNIDNLQHRIGHHGKGSAYVCCDCGSRNIKPLELS